MMLLKQNYLRKIDRSIFLFLLIMGVCYFSFSVLYYLEPIHHFLLIYSISMAMLHFLLAAVHRIYPCDSSNVVKSVLIIYFIIILVSSILQSIFHWLQGDALCFAWFFLIPWGAMVYVRDDKQFTLVWTVIVCVALLLSLFLSALMPASYSAVKLTDFQRKATDIITLIWYTVLVLFFVQQHFKLEKIALEENLVSDDPVKENEITNTKNYSPLSEEKIKSIYHEISMLFENEKPYVNPDYSVADLAKHLKTNMNYVYHVLKYYHPEMNFASFVNQYRIEMVKKMLTEGDREKYTLKHIYTSAGFTSQPNFNKVFRHIEGITPTDYIAQIKANKED